MCNPIIPSPTFPKVIYFEQTVLAPDTPKVYYVTTQLEYLTAIAHLGLAENMFDNLPLTTLPLNPEVQPQLGNYVDPALFYTDYQLYENVVTENASISEYNNQVNFFVALKDKMENNPQLLVGTDLEEIQERISGCFTLYDPEI